MNVGKVPEGLFKLPNSIDEQVNDNYSKSIVSSLNVQLGIKD